MLKLLELVNLTGSGIAESPSSVGGGNWIASLHIKSGCQSIVHFRDKLQREGNRLSRGYRAVSEELVWKQSNCLSFLIKDVLVKELVWEFTIGWKPNGCLLEMGLWPPVFSVLCHVINRLSSSSSVDQGNLFGLVKHSVAQRNESFILHTQNIKHNIDFYFF